MGWIEYLINYPHIVLELDIHSEKEAIQHFNLSKSSSHNIIFDSLIHSYDLTQFSKDHKLENLSDLDMFKYWIYFGFNKCNINSYIVNNNGEYLDETTSFVIDDLSFIISNHNIPIRPMIKNNTKYQLISLTNDKQHTDNDLPSFVDSIKYISIIDTIDYIISTSENHIFHLVFDASLSYQQLQTLFTKLNQLPNNMFISISQFSSSAIDRIAFISSCNSNSLAIVKEVSKESEDYLLEEITAQYYSPNDSNIVSPELISFILLKNNFNIESCGSKNHIVPIVNNNIQHVLLTCLYSDSNTWCINAKLD
jgi:hypothetical protein